VASIPDTEVEIKSADVGVMTSPGLGELKQLINEATVRHAELRDQLATRKKALDRAASRLRWAQWLVIRLFTEGSIPRLVTDANKADDDVDETRVHLEGCFVEVDFPLDNATGESYAALVGAFEALRTAQRIWDITAMAAVDRVTQRTTAQSALTRVPVVFDFTDSETIRSQHRAMRLGNVAGRDLQLFPVFVMMREASRDFALIEFPQFECKLANSNFIEEETIPSDAEQVGATWKRANKDGSRDRRFNDNYQIPVLRYGALAFSSPTGLGEVYQISSYAKAAAFAEAIAVHKRTLAKLNNATEALALPAPADDADEAQSDGPVQAPAFVAKPRDNLAIDWILLVFLGSLAFGGVWAAERWGPLSASTPRARPVEAEAAPTPTPVAPVKHKGHHRRHRATASNSAPVEASPTGIVPVILSPQPSPQPQ
jgi:hypothetical protein